MSKRKRVRFGIVLLVIAALVLGSASTAFAARHFVTRVSSYLAGVGDTSN